MEAADQDGHRKLMLDAGMTLKIIDSRHYVLTIPTAMRAGYPAGNTTCPQPTSAYLAGDSGATIDIEFTERCGISGPRRRSSRTPIGASRMTSRTSSRPTANWQKRC
jgi:hypothetical protein